MHFLPGAFAPKLCLQHYHHSVPASLYRESLPIHLKFRLWDPQALPNQPKL